jgi:DNA-nicking Smr family endonuclease
MSKPGDKPGRSGRTVSEDEARLWRLMTRDLEPVRAKDRVAPAAKSDDPSPSTPARAREQAPETAPSRKTRAPPPQVAVASNSKARPAAPLADFERRKVRQIASGKVEVDARIDLHGARQRDARVQLRAFLLRAHAQGHKTVLVITGKGGEEPADAFGGLIGERQRGVLRRNVPHWLEEADLRAVVLRYAQAGPRHGGAGALYVQLRKSARPARGG